MVCEGLLNLCGTSSAEIIERTKKENAEYYLPIINQLTSQYEDLSSQNENLSSRNKDLSSRNKDLSSRNKDLSSRNKDLSSQIAHLKSLLAQNNIPFNQ